MYAVDVVLALLPRIALPVKETRALLFVAVRATTLRDALPVRDTVLRPDVVVRDVTLRDCVVAAGVVVAEVRDATTGRPVTLRAAAGADVVRATVAAFVRDVAVRPDVRAVAPRCDDTCPVATPAVGAIGSANTARIDNRVEQTNPAPASKNIVPTTFLKISPKLRFFINNSLYPGKPGNLLFSGRRRPRLLVCL